MRVLGTSGQLRPRLKRVLVGTRGAANNSLGTVMSRFELFDVKKKGTDGVYEPLY